MKCTRESVPLMIALSLSDIVARFRTLDSEDERRRTEQSFFVPKEEIVGNDYDLSINKYKRTEYVPVEYPLSVKSWKSCGSWKDRLQLRWTSWRSC